MKTALVFLTLACAGCTTTTYERTETGVKFTRSSWGTKQSISEIDVQVNAQTGDGTKKEVPPALVPFAGQNNPPAQEQPQAAPQQTAQQPFTPPMSIAPVFAQQPQAGAQAAPQMPQQAMGGVPVQAPQFGAPQDAPIQYAQRRPVNLAGLQQALGNRGLYFPKGS